MISKNDLVWCFGDNSNCKYGTDINVKGSCEPVFSTDMLGLNVGEIFVGINNTALLLSDYNNRISNRKDVFDNNVDNV